MVRLKTTAGMLTRVKSGGEGFLSQNDPRLLFGLGQDERAEWMEVVWPSGLKQRFPGPGSGESVVVVEGEDTPRRVVERRFQLPEPLTSEEARLALLRVGPGDALPALELRGLDGQQVSLADVVAPGRPAIVNLWATWCRSCAAEMPELERLHREGEGGGVQVIGISVDQGESRQRIQASLERTGASYPMYVIDRAELGRLLAADDAGIPLSILVDANGRVVGVHHGWSPTTRRALNAMSHESRQQGD